MSEPKEETFYDRMERLRVEWVKAQDEEVSAEEEFRIAEREYQDSDEP